MPAPTDHACQLCQRETRLEFHHLIPRKVHRRPWFAKRHSREEMHQRGIWICRLCHRFLHRRFDEVTLGRQFATLPDLLADPGVQRHIQWAGRQRPGKR